MVAPIYYYSTNRQFSNQSSGDFERISFQEALFQGQAQDEGLFMPDRIPKVSPEELRQLPHMRYPEIASLVLGKFLRPEISASVLSQLA
ncbi:MAG TPA: threonine synthase, partial [Bacteroidetes bacterium]|nr:threonine synthase [Bacteroidota bacterium]